MIVPMILMVFSVLMYLLFYYHDKTILWGTAHETLAIASSLPEEEIEEAQEYFDKRIRGRLLLFSYVDRELELGEQKVSMRCKTSKKGMSIDFVCEMSKTEPEAYIRNIRKIEKIGQGVVDKSEDILQE